MHTSQSDKKKKTHTQNNLNLILTKKKEHSFTN